MTFDRKFRGHNFIPRSEFGIQSYFKCKECSVEVLINVNYVEYNGEIYLIKWNDFYTETFKKENLITCNEFLIKKLIE